MSVVYIAGPMSGHEDWNFPAFFSAEEEIKDLGYQAINPARSDGETVEEALKSAGSPDKPNFTWEHYMRRDLPMVMASDIVCLLPGWQTSRGARLESYVATELGIPLMILQKGELVPRVSILGLSGYARSGKDTAANYFVENQGYVKISFADPIREALYELNPTVELDGKGFKPLKVAIDLLGETWESLKDHKNGDVRGLLQRLGTEVGREMFDQDLWVKQAINRIEDGAKVVVSDVRFENEAEAIKNLGGLVFRIERGGVGPTSSHKSETSLEDYSFDAVVTNDGDIKSLHTKLGLLTTIFDL